MPDVLAALLYQSTQESPKQVVDVKKMNFYKNMEAILEDVVIDLYSLSPKQCIN